MREVYEVENKKKKESRVANGIERDREKCIKVGRHKDL